MCESTFRFEKTGSGVATLATQGHSERKVGRQQERMGFFCFFVCFCVFCCSVVVVVVFKQSLS